MQLSTSAYRRLAKGVGGLLTFMGLFLLVTYSLFASTGLNLFAEGLPQLQSIGLVFVGSMGAFALPVGGFLLRGGPDTTGRLRLAAVALGLMAIVRLLAFANLEIRAQVGFAALVEFFVLGAIALVSGLARSKEAY